MTNEEILEKVDEEIVKVTSEFKERVSTAMNWWKEHREDSSQGFVTCYVNINGVRGVCTAYRISFRDQIIFFKINPMRSDQALIEGQPCGAPCIFKF